MIIHLYVFLARICLQILNFVLALKFFMRAKIGDLHLLMARMIISSVSLHKRYTSYRVFTFPKISFVYCLIRFQLCISPHYIRDYFARLIS